MILEGVRRNAGGGTGEKPLFSSGVPLRPMLPKALAFTLIELVLVMAVLVTMLAIVAPVISRSMRGRNLTQQGARLLALTEYSRDEAASLGVPMTVWINPETRSFGTAVKAGYAADTARTKEYTLPADLSFESLQGAQASKAEGHGFEVAEFEPDGTMDPASVAVVRIFNRTRSSVVSVTQTQDKYGYEVIKEAGQ